MGGYLSQCCHEEAHYEEFIRKEDIEQIAKWGYDHVRLPIDYNVLEKDDGAVKEGGFLQKIYKSVLLIYDFRERYYVRQRRRQWV